MDIRYTTTKNMMKKRTKQLTPHNVERWLFVGLLIVEVIKYVLHQ